MKNQNIFLTLLISLFTFVTSFAQINLDVERDGTISGKLGIGTNAPEQKLHIVGGSDVNGTDGGHIQMGYSSGVNLGIDQNEIQARNNGVPSELSINPNGGNVNLSFNKFFLDGINNNIGIGTRNPTQELMIYRNTTQNVDVRLENLDGDKFDIFSGSVDCGLWSLGNKFMKFGTNGTERMRIDDSRLYTQVISFEHGYLNSGDRPTFIDLHSQDGVDYSARVIRWGGVNGNFNITNTGTGLIQFITNSNNEVMRMDANGTVTVYDKLIVTGSDFAERFQVNTTEVTKAEALRGMLVVIDETNEGQLTPCTQAYDKKVAGIVSGAGGVSTGLVMGEPNTLADGDIPVAMTGRVYCYADASYGAIEVGDMLTTSPTEGHAMKAKAFFKRQGAVIGKAMTALPQGEKGLILVLINAQ